MLIANNLRKLRLEKGLTQEELATRLNVTGQAVGKWERDECYPDITLLPGLANLFGVSVDKLIGLDEVNRQNKVIEIQDRKNELAAQGKYAELVEYLEEESKNHPNELLDELGIALALAGDKSERPLRLLEQALEESGTKSYKHRGTIYAELCFLYERYGMTEKAEELAYSLPHVWENREFLLPHFLPKEKREVYLKENLPRILTTICALIDMDLMTVDEHIHSIQYGMYKKDVCPVEVCERIIGFIGQ